MSARISNIQTNIVTGFLGAGKSTAILKLLEQKPADENWAVLVNEFGEVGIDGGMMSGNADTGVFIREVPGGCMCCSAGLPMQMAMNMLIAKANPTRLIIEPTGLGHPFEVMSVLAAEHYQELLDLRATITLVDARKISDDRYTSHETFNQQLQIADVIVASKQDLYGVEDLQTLEHYLTEQSLVPPRSLISMTDGRLDLTQLDAPARAWQAEPAKPIDLSLGEPEPVAPDFPAEGFIRMSNSGEGFLSFGWLFEPSVQFDKLAIEQLFHASDTDRLKAILKTDLGNVGYNYAGDQLEVIPLRDLEDSRIEIIARDFDPEAFEDRLLSECIKSR